MSLACRVHVDEGKPKLHEERGSGEMNRAGGHKEVVFETRWVSEVSTMKSCWVKRCWRCCCRWCFNEPKDLEACNWYILLWLRVSFPDDMVTGPGRGEGTPFPLEPKPTRIRREAGLQLLWKVACQQTKKNAQKRVKQHVFFPQEHDRLKGWIAQTFAVQQAKSPTMGYPSMCPLVQWFWRAWFPIDAFQNWDDTNCWDSHHIPFLLPLFPVSWYIPIPIHVWEKHANKTGVFVDR